MKLFRKKNRKNKLARYFHTQGYGRLAGGFMHKRREKNLGLFKFYYVGIGVIFLLIGVVYLLGLDRFRFF